MSFEEKTIESKIVYEGPVFKVRKHRVTTINGESYRDIIEHNGGAVMIAITDEGKIIMEKQFRKAVERDVLELPAGKIDPGEEPMAAAIREIQEETGFKPGITIPLIQFSPNCGYAREKSYIFIMRELTPCEKHPDPDESIDIVEYTADELMDMIMSNEIEDAKTIIGIMRARLAGEI